MDMTRRTAPSADDREALTTAPNPGERRASGDPRRSKLLDAALATFLRFGYRKTSMEEVARAAHLSRQALYLHFATKEELFHAAVAHAMTQGLEAASNRLCDGTQSLEARIAGAFDAWTGRYVGLAGDVADLQEAAETLVGSLVTEHEARFVEMIARAIRASSLPAAYKSAGISARQLADTLHATARGLKHACSSRAEFGERFGVAVRALCVPVRGRA
jgi:TetR/AcrR family transcriptional regulator, regulator of autoinduction and epiphytic fitness